MTGTASPSCVRPMAQNVTEIWAKIAVHIGREGKEGKRIAAKEELLLWLSHQGRGKVYLSLGTDRRRQMGIPELSIVPTAMLSMSRTHSESPFSSP